MIKCPGCGAEITPQMAFCPMCGNSIRPRESDSGDDWFYIFKEHQHGPVSESSLINLIEAGQLTHDTLVWKSELSEWTKAGDIEDLVFPSKTCGVENASTAESQQGIEEKTLVLHIF